MNSKELLVGVCEIFREQKVPYAVIDGYSAFVHGSPYNTLDIGLVVSPEKINHKLLGKLEGIGLEPTEMHEDIEHLHSFGQFVHKETGIIVHIFSEFHGVVLHKGIGTEVWDIDGKEIHVCNPTRNVILKASLCANTDKLKAVVLSKSHKHKPMNSVFDHHESRLSYRQ